MLGYICFVLIVRHMFLSIIIVNLGTYGSHSFVAVRLIRGNQDYWFSLFQSVWGGIFLYFYVLVRIYI